LEASSLQGAKDPSAYLVMPLTHEKKEMCAESTKVMKHWVFTVKGVVKMIDKLHRFFAMRPVTMTENSLGLRCQLAAKLAILS
jgi:hypothetical protein